MVVLRRLAERAVELRSTGVPRDVMDAAVRAVTDWVAAAVAGSVLPVAKVLRSALVRDTETGPARLVPDATPVPIRTAALINGAVSHAAEVDDIFRDGLYHPGSPTVAAALAAAEDSDADGEGLLRAVVIGYEIGDRIAAAIQPRHYENWHTTGTVGTIGAAAAAAEAFELDVNAFTHALALATTMAAGLQQSIRSDAMSKVLHAGHAADAGVLAAVAARAGMTGVPDVLEGPAGFGAAMADNPDWEMAVEAWGRPYGITVATVKNHSCCGHCFAAVDAVLALRPQLPPLPEIARIEVGTYRAALAVTDKSSPRTANEAKFSTPYCVAAALKLGSLRIRAFEEAALEDEEIRSLAARVRMSVDPDAEAAYPRQRSARVTVIAQDGRRFEHFRNTRKGDPDDPLSDAELQDKFVELVTPVLGSAATDRLLSTLWELPKLGRVRQLDWRGKEAP